ncbi:MAG TPA: abortive infection family protein [Dermatophilaceae bacterium]|nr:abortive infection family protein [Dermatophilaceae bacterium]
MVELATTMFARETGFSGPDLHRLFAEYTEGLGEYTGWGGGSESRWQIFQRGLKLLSFGQQVQFLLGLCEYDGNIKHGRPSDEDIAKLRALLLGQSAPGSDAAAERLAALTDWKAVQDSWRQALDKIHSDPEGAITATRTLLESTCKHICDERGVSYENNWDLSRLYKATAGAMEIAPDQHSEQVIKQILSGVSTVVTGLGSLRNSLSDAHGRGKRAVRPAPRHAKLAVNAGFAVAGFLIDTHIERPSPTVRS